MSNDTVFIVLRDWSRRFQISLAGLYLPAVTLPPPHLTGCRCVHLQAVTAPTRAKRGVASFNVL